MSHDDPREAGGSIIGPGGPHDRGGVTFDTRRAVLVDGWDTAVTHPTVGGVPQPDAVAIAINGRINRPPDHKPQGERPAERVSYLNLLDWEAAAALVVDLHSLAARNGNQAEFHAMLERGWADYERRGLTREAPR